MNKLSILIVFFCANLIYAQKLSFETLLHDEISIRAIEIHEDKVWYAGSNSKFGFVSLKDPTDKNQIKLSDKKLEFRTLAQDKNFFYTINITSPAYFYKIDKKSLKSEVIYTDTVKTVFYDAMIFNGNNGLAISDPDKNLSPTVHWFTSDKHGNYSINLPNYFEGEAHFAASNTNIAMKGSSVWIATGGSKARIFKFDWIDYFNWEVFNTPFIQGSSAQGIYSIDFYDKNFGIAVGGDYTQQSANINNIATTDDGGETWQIQASGKNAGYKTCVKIRPNSKGKDIIAVGDQNIEFSIDYGKTWTKISDEKGLFVCKWVDDRTLVFAGKNRIVKAKLNF